MKKPMNKKTYAWTLFIFIAVYFLLKYMIPFGEYILYPITLLVTFLHEFGHWFMAIISWWRIEWIQINRDWSWYATTAWWIQSLILMWWYIGSAIFWNLLLYIWFTQNKLAKTTLCILAGLMVFTSLYWFNSFLTSFILIVGALWLILINRKTELSKLILQFLWLSTILYIIEDFNVWPSSDLWKFAEIFVIIPQSAWMVIWLIVVLLITLFNIKQIKKAK